MYSKRNLCRFIFTTLTVNVILSSNVTDVTNTTTTTDVLTTLNPTDERTTATVITTNIFGKTNATDRETTTVITTNTFGKTDATDRVNTAVTDLTNTFRSSQLTTLSSSDVDDDTTAITAQTTLASSSAEYETSTLGSTSAIATSTSQPTTLEPTTTVMPSTAQPFSLECDVNRCPNNERCLVRQAPTGTDFVCECASVRGSTFGYYCNHTYYRDFFSTIPLRTCYGPECATGSQSSENYPNDYRDRTGQMMVVYVPGTFRFDLSFDDRGIGIEYFKDDLVIGGGFRPSIEEVPAQPEAKEALQGVHYINGFDTPADFSIFSDSMWIWFQTDPSIVFKGFNVSWSSVAIAVECPEDLITLNLPDDSDYVRGGWNPPFIQGAGVGIENLQISSNYNPNDILKIGRYDVNYQYRDTFGNTAECKFPLIVRDITRPVVLDCPQNIEVETCDRMEVNWTEPIAYDNSNDIVTEEMLINRGADNVQRGLNIIVYTFSDQSGNRQECSFEVNIVCNTGGPDGPVGIEFWIILAAAAGAVALLLLILAFFAHAKLAAIKAANQADLSFNPEEFQGHKPGAPLEEEAPLTNGKEKVGMYELHGFSNGGAV